MADTGIDNQSEDTGGYQEPRKAPGAKKRRYRRRTVDSAENYERISKSHVKDTVSTISRYKVLVEHEPEGSDYDKELSGNAKRVRLMRSLKDLTTEKLLAIYHSEDQDEDTRMAAREMAYLKTIFLVPSTINYMYSVDTETFNDAVQNASLTMLTAMEWFKPNLGYTFAHYNLGYFRSAMSRTFRDKNVVDFPSGVLGNRTKKDDGVVYKQESYDPDAERVREATEPDHSDSEHRPVPAGSLSSFSEYNDEYAYGMGMESSMYNGSSVEDESCHGELRQILDYAVSKESGILTDDEREVLILHSGLYGEKEHHYKEIAEIRAARGQGASCSRISQLNTSAKNKIKEWLETKGYDSPD